MKISSALVLLLVSMSASAEECANIIALSKIISTTVEDKNSLETHASNFCSEYSLAKSSGNTMNISASYKFIAASYGSSQVSAEEMASKYCSATSSNLKRDDAYKQYIETISPNAYTAYEQCIQMSRNNIKFSLDSGSILPKEFSMTASFQQSARLDTADLVLTTSKDVDCVWSQNGTKMIHFSGIGSADLSCNRNDQTVKSFVKVTRVDGGEKITFPWPAYDKNGVLIDTISDLQKNIRILSNKISVLEVGEKSSVVAFNLKECPAGWTEYLLASGRFIRGIDKSGLIDTEKMRNPGELQDDTFKSHEHKQPVNYGGTGFITNPQSIPALYFNRQTSNRETGKMSSEGGSETRPKNVALLYCSK